MPGNDLVGRSAELARVDDSIARTLDGRGAVLLFAGEPGIGKTTLADAVSDRAKDAGAIVAWGRCWEGGGAPPFWPWTQVFRALGEADPFAASPADDARQARFALFDRAAEALRARAQRDPIVVILDDLHAADVPSLHFAHLVARNVRAGGRIAVVGTYRDAEARLAGETAQILAKIAREGDVIMPGRLSRDDVARWVRSVHPDATEEAIARIHRASEGNPLFVEELLRVRTTLDPSSLPDGLRAVVDEHVRRATPEVRAVLEVASVLGRDIDEDAVADLAQLDADTVHQRFVEARASGLVVAPREAGRPRAHAFAHILIRDRLHAALPPSRRAELHVRVADRCDAAGDVASAAHHLLEAGPSVADRAARIALVASRAAVEGYAYEAAGELAERALAVAPAASELACRLAIVVAEAMIRRGHANEGKTRALEAADLAERLGDAHLLAEAALVHGAELTTGTVDPKQIDVLRRARDALETAPASDLTTRLRIRVFARYASALVPPRSAGEYESAVAHARQGLAMAKELGDPETELYALRFASSALGYWVDQSESFALRERIHELATQLGKTFTLIDARSVYAMVRFERGDRAVCDELVASWTEIVRATKQPHIQWRPSLVFATLALFDGDLERSAAHAEDAYRLAESAGMIPAFVAWAMYQLGLFLLTQDRARLAPHAERLLAIARLAPVSVSLAILKNLGLALTGREDEARAVERARLDTRNGPGFILAAPGVLVLGDQAGARELLPGLLEARKNIRIFWGAHGCTMMGPTALAAGDVARLVGDEPLARSLYDEAEEVGRRMGSRMILEAIAARRGTPRPSRPPPASKRGATNAIAIEQDGDVWRIRSATGGAATIKDGKGIRFLAELVRAEGRELHVTQLVGIDDVEGDVGPVLDAKAKAAYKERLEDLRDRLEDARRNHDAGAAEKAEAEIDAIADQLAGAVGLGGRDRKVGSHVERARINVQRRLKDVLKKVEAQDPSLAKYLEACVKTGTWCSFSPV